MAAASARLYMFLGGTFLAGGGLIAVACTTDNGGTTPVPIANDSGRDTGNGSSSGGSSGGSSGSPDDGGGADCGNIPTPKSSQGVYCQGANVDAGADASPHKTCNSANNEICCGGTPIDSGVFNPSSCEVATEDTPGYQVGTCNASTQLEWHCTEPSHCPGAAVCCVMRSDAGAPLAQQDDDYPGCPVYFTSGRFVGGTRCRVDDCEAQELQLCSQDSDCANISANAKCHSITVSGKYTGVCKL
jgi:hypothetical protein